MIDNHSNPKGDVQILRMCDRIRLTAADLHMFLRDGHPEKVYENGLAHRLKKMGIKVEQQRLLQVRDRDGTLLGDFFADLFIEDCLIIELKSCSRLAKEHVAQMLGYLRASGLRHGLLINFGGPKLEIRKLVL